MQPRPKTAYQGFLSVCPSVTSHSYLGTYVLTPYVCSDMLSRHWHQPCSDTLSRHWHQPCSDTLSRHWNQLRWSWRCGARAAAVKIGMRRLLVIRWQQWWKKCWDSVMKKPSISKRATGKSVDVVEESAKKEERGLLINRVFVNWEKILNDETSTDGVVV